VPLNLPSARRWLLVVFPVGRTPILQDEASIRPSLGNHRIRSNVTELTGTACAPLEDAGQPLSKACWIGIRSSRRLARRVSPRLQWEAGEEERMEMWLGM
jgi:hypothetical protein